MTSCTVFSLQLRSFRMLHYTIKIGTNNYFEQKQQGWTQLTIRNTLYKSKKLERGQYENYFCLPFCEWNDYFPQGSFYCFKQSNLTLRGMCPSACLLINFTTLLVWIHKWPQPTGGWWRLMGLAVRNKDRLAFTNTADIGMKKRGQTRTYNFKCL